MMSYPPMNELLDKGGCTFTTIVVASKRARRLSQGASDLLEEYHGTKDVSKALEELVAGKIKPVLEEE